MTEYYEEGGLLYEQSPPMHIKVESPEGPFGGGVSEDGFPREDEDSDGSCDQSSGLPGGLPFNVVVVHPNLMAPGMSSDDLMSIDQSRSMSAALAASSAGKRKSRFSGAELEVLVSEVTRCEGELFGPAGRLRRRERERIWAGILERVNAVSRVPRTLREVKKRWDDLKRRNGGRLADARHRSCYLPSSRGSSMLGRPSQSSPRLHQSRQKQSSRPKTSFPCFTDSDPVGGGDGSERDGLEKDEDNPEREREVGEPESEGAENSMEDKLGLGLGLGIGPPPPSDRWLPPSPLYSAPFLNGSPQPSPQPSLGAQQGPLEAPSARGSWLEDELRGLGEAAVQLGDRIENSLREFGESFRHDMRTLVASQETLAVSLQQNNVLLQRLLSVLEAQQQPQTQQQQHRSQQPQQPQQHVQPQQPQQHVQPQQPQQHVQPQQPQQHVQPQQPQQHVQPQQPQQHVQPQQPQQHVQAQQPQQHVQAQQPQQHVQPQQPQQHVQAQQPQQHVQPQQPQQQQIEPQLQQQQQRIEPQQQRIEPQQQQQPQQQPHVVQQQPQQQRIEPQQQQQPQPQQQPHVVQQQPQQHQPQIQQQQLSQRSNNQSVAVVVPTPPADAHGTFHPEPPAGVNGSAQRPRRGRTVDHRRRRRR